MGNGAAGAGAGVTATGGAAEVVGSSTVGGVAESSWPLASTVGEAGGAGALWLTVDDCLDGLDVGTDWQAARMSTNSGRVKNTRIDNLSD
ncbi:MAG: hypothetical protein ACO223_11135 [Burkholderiaceae bacterium]